MLSSSTPLASIPPERVFLGSMLVLLNYRKLYQTIGNFRDAGVVSI